jgi:hypothetical protein
MRVANSEAIRKGEKALADAIASNFDHSVIRKIFKRVHNLDVGEEIKCKHASMGVHGDEVAYSMNFEVMVNLSVFLDRAGNFISISSSGVASELSPKTEEPMVEAPESPPAGEKPQVLEAPPEKDASSPGGTYEAVLKAFAPIESESETAAF